MPDSTAKLQSKTDEQNQVLAARKLLDDPKRFQKFYIWYATEPATLLKRFPTEWRLIQEYACRFVKHKTYTGDTHQWLWDWVAKVFGLGANPTVEQVIERLRLAVEGEQELGSHPARTQQSMIRQWYADVADKLNSARTPVPPTPPAAAADSPRPGSSVPIIPHPEWEKNREEIADWVFRRERFAQRNCPELYRQAQELIRAEPSAELEADYDRMLRRIEAVEHPTTELIETVVKATLVAEKERKSKKHSRGNTPQGATKTKKPLEESNPEKAQIYRRIRQEHSHKGRRKDTLDRLKRDKSFAAQVTKAGLKLDTKLLTAALAWSDSPARKKHESPKQ